MTIMQKKVLCAVVAGGLATAGCASTGGGEANNQTVGTVLGTPAAAPLLAYSSTAGGAP